jgi:hypothetical protein
MTYLDGENVTNTFIMRKLFKSVSADYIYNAAGVIKLA